MSQAPRHGNARDFSKDLGRECSSDLASPGVRLGFHLHSFLGGGDNALRKFYRIFVHPMNYLHMSNAKLKHILL